MRALVIGLAVTGDAITRFLVGRGDDVTVLEDAAATDDETVSRRDRAAAMGVRVVEQPRPDAAAALAESVDLVVPSPGVPERHPAIAAARRGGIAVRSEVDLAAELGGPTLVAVTGTNGKTTVTTLATAMLEATGVRAIAAGNIGLPLIDAMRDGVDVVVAEVSSFQLASTTTFRPSTAALLNLGADHLDWHRTFESYAQAKARIFTNQRDDDLLVFNADDPVVAGLAAGAPARALPFSVTPGAASGYRITETVSGQLLVDPDGLELAVVEALPRRAAPDLANALAASALALDAGASVDAVRATLLAFEGLAHRLRLIGEHRGVRWIDDSKATNPHATIAAVRGLQRVVLVAGGRNKGLDLGELRVTAPSLRAVVAIGEAADEVADAFADVVPVARGGSMDEAVRVAAALALPGDTVLLSPACASFDWYASYAARGDDFARAVRDLVEVDG
jgi:UDP-N-acetylmuramoylalanine--D-glutamate ligase